MGKDSRLSKAEKKLAERSYKLERTSKITYSRPSYAAFYPKPGSGPATNLHNPGSRGYTRNRYYEHGKRLDTWLPSAAPRPVASVGIQQVEVPRDLVIPTGHDSPPVSLVAGQTVMVIKTPKGIYLRLDEKIIKIKQPAAVQGLLGCKLAKEDEDWPSSASSSG